MKITSEAKLLAGLAAFVLLGAAFLFLSNRPSPPPPTVPVADEDAKALFADAFEKSRNVKGPEDAAVSVVEFADFQCPTCRRAYASLVGKLGEKLPVRFAFRHLPLEMHPYAEPAAVAAEAAGRQGKFWPMYRALFAPGSHVFDEVFIVRSARAAGLDMARFEKDRKDPAVLDLVKQDVAVADKYGISMTPTFVVRDASGQVTRFTGVKELENLLTRSGILAAPKPPAAGN